MARKPGTSGRWRRRIFTFCAVVSLLLCVAVCGLWVRSYYIADTLHWDRVWDGEGKYDFQRVQVNAADGGFSAWSYFSYSRASWINRDGITESDFHPGLWWTRIPTRSIAGLFEPRGRWGFHFDRDDQERETRGPISGHRVFRSSSAVAVIPAWFAFTLTATIPLCCMANILRRWLQNRKQSFPTTCPICGYDLRATRDRCPECGTAPA